MVNEPDAKAILPEPRSVQKANSYQELARDSESLEKSAVDFARQKLGEDVQFGQKEQVRE